MSSDSRDDSPPSIEKNFTTSDSKYVEATDAGEAIVSKHGETLAIIDPKAERALVWKFDLRILPVLAVMYLFNSLDKSNLGNAKTAGLEKTLGLKNHDYNVILSIFFIPYVLTAPFLAILGKKYGPNRVLPLMIFYRRGELARRLALFYAAQSIASAFGGLLAFGVFQIKSGSLADWRYLFIIEGCCTVCFSAFAFWYLPRSSSEASFLSQQEKELAYYRMQIDSSSVVNEKFDFRESFKIFKHPTSWMILCIEICLGVPLQSVQLFLPQIIGRLGYSTVKTNLYTVAPNVSGAVMLLILAFASDYTRWRFPFVAAGFLFTFIGFIIYVGIDVESQLHVAYYAAFMMTWGTSAPSVLLDVWYNNNIAHEGRRVVLTSFGVPLANLMGVVSSNIFQNKDAVSPSSPILLLFQEPPKYIPALATTAAFGGMGCILTLLLGAWMMVDNKRRDSKRGEKLNVRDIPTERLRDGPAAEEFRWFY
ncbi:MAG: hypothetical protein Q9220_004332 [cf. Caloplaca sp. 1 TL-2023]